MQVLSRKNFILNSFVICIAAILAGCHSVPRYEAAPGNVTKVREVRRNILLGEFTGGGAYASCRAEFMYANSQDMQNKDAFAIYVRNALESEVKSAGIRPGLPSSKVSLKLLNVEVLCGIFEGASWTLEGEVTIEGKTPFVVKTQTDFEFSISGAQIVPDAKAAFPSAVQTFIAGIMAHPTYRSVFY